MIVEPFVGVHRSGHDTGQRQLVPGDGHSGGSHAVGEKGANQPYQQKIYSLK